MKGCALFLLAFSFCYAQPDTAAETLSQAEEKELSAALAEAGSSPLEFIRALEKHLSKYPQSPRKAELEQALVKAAIETKDEKRILLYGERVLARDADDPQILERVIRALLATEGQDQAERALKYARHLEELVAGLRKQSPPGRMRPGQWQEELDRSVGRALVLQAKADGILGKVDAAVSLAHKAYQTYPTAEAAREIGRWLAKAGREEDAIAHLADAFTIADPRNTDTDRAKDRMRMGELYRKVKGTEKGLGDLVLEAYDRAAALLAERRLRLRESDPNAQSTKVLDFTLTGVDGEKLQMSSLRGKTLIFDFWATWCGPCRAQHPLYEEVKKRFEQSRDVLFLSISTDEDRELVEPFLRAQKWDQKVYFEDGMSRMLQISSIPTTVIVDKHGEVFSRLNGFLPNRFVDMLTDRIREALKN